MTSSYLNIWLIVYIMILYIISMIYVKLILTAHSENGIRARTDSEDQVEFDSDKEDHLIDDSDWGYRSD